MPSPMLVLLQVAVEYGSSVARSGTGAATGGGGWNADQLLARWNAVVPFPPWVALGGAALLWLAVRGRRGGGSSGVGLGTVFIIAVIVGAMYLFARARGLL